MKLLKCKLCHGEMDIISNEKGVHKKVKCNRCGWSNENSQEHKDPEILIIRKRNNKQG